MRFLAQILMGFGLGGFALVAGAEDITYRVHLVEQVEVAGEIVDSSDTLAYTGSGFQTAKAAERPGYLFCGWRTNTKQDDATFAARDAWGRAYEQVSFNLYESMTNTAVYVATDLDLDHDGMADGTELYWYGNLDQDPASDTDGDGIGFAEELERGLNPHFADTWLRGVDSVSASLPSHRVIVRSEPAGVLLSSYTTNVVENTYFLSQKFDPEESQFSHWLKDGIVQVGSYGEPLQRVKFQMPSNDVVLVAVCKTYRLVVRCEPEGALFPTTTNYLLRGESVTTQSYSPRSSSFASWIVDGARQSDALGRADDSVTFLMPTHDVDVVAICSDDALKREALYWYGEAATDAASDTDGDGLTLAEEIALGTNPLFADNWQRGILTATRKPQFFKYTLRSEPEGRLFATQIESVCPGVIKTTPSYQAMTSEFAYWEINGAAVRDDFGRAKDFVSLEMPTENIEVVAVCRENEAQRQALYWYGDETVTAASDTDGDGLTLAEEIALGTNPLFADNWQRGILTATRKPQFFKYTLRSEPEGRLFATQIESVCPGVIKTTPSYQAMTSEFAYWKIGGVAQRDDFGRALDDVILEMPTNDIEVVAVCVSDAAVRESVYWYGNETTALDSDVDGDGYTFAEELALGLNPLFADSYDRGIVSTSSKLDLFKCTLRSEPENRLFATRVLNLAPGMAIVTDSYSPLTSVFSYWAWDGMRQADEFGRALEKLTLSMPTKDTEVVAVCHEDELTREAYYWYGEEMPDDSDTDGDGRTFAEERATGTNPLFADVYRRGIYSSLSEQLEVDLQPFEQMRGTIVDGNYEELFTSTLAGNAGSSVSFGAKTCPLAADVNGDGLFDLVIVSATGLRVFINTGSTANPEMTEQSVSEGIWASLEALVKTMMHPVICEYEGVFYLSDNGGIISRFDTADGTITDTGLEGIPGILDGLLVALSSEGRLVAAGSKPTCSLDTPVLDGQSIAFADIDADGRTDFLASDADGHVWLYRNESYPYQLRAGTYVFVLKHKVWAGTGAGFAAGMTISLIDWEDDGDQDVLIGTADGKLMLLRDPRTGRPTNVRAYPGADNVLLEWDPNAQPRIRGYNVYRAPDSANFIRVANQTPLPSYRDVPKVLQDYWYRVTGVSRFYIAGNSTPTVHESMPTDAVYVQFRPSVWLNDTSSFTETNVEVIVSMDNSMGLSADGFSMTFAYDPAVLEPIEMKTTGLSDQLEFDEVEEIGGGGQRNWKLLARGGEIGVGSGRFLRLVFHVKVVHDVSETIVSLTAATVKAADGHAVMLDLPKSARITISDAHPIVPAIVGVSVADAAVESESEFELPVTIVSTETLTNFAAEVVFDEKLLELRGADGAAVRRDGVVAPYHVTAEGGDFALKFYAKDPASVATNLSTEVTLKGIQARDCHGFDVTAGDAAGTVLLRNVHPWVPATVSVSTEDRKVDTLEEVTIPFKVTSDQRLTRGRFVVEWDEAVLACTSGLESASPVSSPLTIEANGDFSLKFLVKDQHDVTKTLVRVTAAEVEDIHGFVVHPSVPVVSTVLIHDAHPLVPAKVSMTLADVSVKTETEFGMVLAITTTEALTDLRMNLAYDTALLTLKSGVLSYTGSVPSSVKLRFYAKENHTVGSTKVTVSPVSGMDHNGLAAELPTEVSGTVILADSNPWVPAVVGVSVGSVKTDTLCEFELPVTVTSNETLTHFTGEVAWDESVVELRGIDGRAVNAPVPPYRFETSGGNFKLKFFAKNQHAVTKTNVRLSGMTAVDVHGLTANPIADALGVVLIHDAQPLVPAGVAMNVSKVYSDTLSTFALPIVITSTKTLTNLTVTVGWDATALEFRSVANGRMDGQTLTVSGTVPSTIYLTFYAKDQHKITETTVTLSGASARCIDGLAAKITTVNGTVYLTDANAPVPVEMTVATWHSKVKSGEAFKVPIGATTSGDLATLTVDVDWDASQLTFVGCPSAKSVTTLAANARRFIFDCTGNYNVFNLDFKAPVIAGLQAGSWTRVTAASGVGRNGLTAVVKTDLPRTGNVMIVREVGKYDPGDIDGDGAYTANDLLILNGYVVYLKMAAKGAVFGESYATTYLKQYGVNVKLTGSAARAADVNCDGSVDTSDIAMLQMLIKEAEGVGK